jgi:hypothetical protein
MPQLMGECVVDERLPEPVVEGLPVRADPPSGTGEPPSASRHLVTRRGGSEPAG